MQLQVVKNELIILADDRDEYDAVFVPMERKEPRFVELNNQERTMTFKILLQDE